MCAHQSLLGYLARKKQRPHRTTIKIQDLRVLNFQDLNPSSEINAAAKGGDILTLTRTHALSLSLFHAHTHSLSLSHTHTAKGGDAMKAEQEAELAQKLIKELDQGIPARDVSHPPNISIYVCVCIYILINKQ